MSEEGPMVSVRSGGLFGGSGFEGGRDMGVETFCGRLSAVSIFLADAAFVRGGAHCSREGGDQGSRVSGGPRSLFSAQPELITIVTAMSLHYAGLFHLTHVDVVIAERSRSAALTQSEDKDCIGLS